MFLAKKRICFIRNKSATAALPATVALLVNTTLYYAFLCCCKFMNTTNANANPILPVPTQTSTSTSTSTSTPTRQTKRSRNNEDNNDDNNNRGVHLRNSCAPSKVCTVTSLFFKIKINAKQ